MREKSTMWWSSMPHSTLTSVNGLRWDNEACFKATSVTLFILIQLCHLIGKDGEGKQPEDLKSAATGKRGSFL